MTTELQIRRQVAIDMVNKLGYQDYRDYLFYEYNNAKSFQKELKMKAIRALNYVVNHKLVEVA